MLNIIKMDLYRMLKTKSMYVIWIVLAAILLITTSLCKTDYELLTENWDISRNYYLTIYYYVEIPAAGERHLPPIGVYDET